MIASEFFEMDTKLNIKKIGKGCTIFAASCGVLIILAFGLAGFLYEYIFLNLLTDFLDTASRMLQALGR